MYVNLFSIIHRIKIEVEIERFSQVGLQAHVVETFNSNFNFDAMNKAKEIDVYHKHSNESLWQHFVLMFQSIFQISDNSIAVLLLCFATFCTLAYHLQLEGLEQFVTKLPHAINSAKVIAGCLFPNI